MACPFFFPTEKTYAVGWAFPARLPLGAGFCGTCRAAHKEVTPTEAELRDFCNLGYAAQCPRLPVERRADCVRFALVKYEAAGKDEAAESESQRIVLQYVVERDHAPVGHGVVEYDCNMQQWLAQVEDACWQRQAAAYLAVYLERRPSPSGDRVIR